VIHDNERTTVRTFEPPLPTVTREQAFDKLSFREAIDPGKQYPPLDGVSAWITAHRRQRHLAVQRPDRICCSMSDARLSALTTTCCWS
jgi:hypothetical protein